MVASRLAFAAPADDLVAAGELALGRMDVVVAMDAFSRALEADPKHVQAAYQRGRMLLKIGEPENAIADFTTAILGNPSFGRAFAKRGEAKLVLKSPTDAFADFDRAVAVSPGDHEVFVIRATYKWKAGDAAGAVSDMQNAIAVADQTTADKIRALLARMTQ
jgi:tetratricopeptide (TPR) repeat protein